MPPLKHICLMSSSTMGMQPVLFSQTINGKWQEKESKTVLQPIDIIARASK